jgi:hypothetical protein
MRRNRVGGGLCRCSSGRGRSTCRLEAASTRFENH